ncbi:Mu transposase C-terminal domain-containing protein [Rhizobium beringeri]
MSIPLRLPHDPDRFCRDFLPFNERCIRRDGLHLFGIRYWDDVLSPLTSTVGAQVRVKFDLRDLSCVYVEQGRTALSGPSDLRLWTAAHHPWEHRWRAWRSESAGVRSVDENWFSTPSRSNGDCWKAPFSRPEACAATWSEPNRRTRRWRGPSGPPETEAEDDLHDFVALNCRGVVDRICASATGGIKVKQLWRRRARGLIRSDRWLETAQARSALMRLEDLLSYPPRDRMPCLLLYGDAGMGENEEHPVNSSAITRPPFDRSKRCDHHAGRGDAECSWRSRSNGTSTANPECYEAPELASDAVFGSRGICEA